MRVLEENVKAINNAVTSISDKLIENADKFTEFTNLANLAIAKKKYEKVRDQAFNYNINKEAAAIVFNKLEKPFKETLTKIKEMHFNNIIKAKKIYAQAEMKADEFAQAEKIQTDEFKKAEDKFKEAEQIRVKSFPKERFDIVKKEQALAIDSIIQLMTNAMNSISTELDLNTIPAKEKQDIATNIAKISLAKAKISLDLHDKPDVFTIEHIAEYIKTIYTAINNIYIAISSIKL